MSDVLPKFKLYFFICFISFLINISIILVKMNFQTTDLFGFTLGSFIPFVNLLVLVGTSFPFELTALITMVLVVLSSIQVFLLAMFLLQTVANLIWTPDV